MSDPKAYIDTLPVDDGESWPRTVVGALARLKQCHSAGEVSRDARIHIDWLYWFGEWELAFEWLSRHAPEEAARIVAEQEAELQGSAK